MKVLGIIGSPRRRQGRSHQVVDRVLAGARAAGAETEALDLIDEEPQYCVHCGHACFEEGDCAQEAEATARSQRVAAADALVICAPVYCWQPNGLTAALFDKVRLPTGPWSREGQHGRPGLGIALAGGSGTGVFPALQSIYAWLCLWKYRPLDPLPVTRFNLERVLGEAEALGRLLAETPPQPYDGGGEQMLTYDRLPYLGYGRIDEFRWLAERILTDLEVRGKTGNQVEVAQRLLAEARACATRGDQAGEAERLVEAYRAGERAW
jgi:NAD(P)H-dependent FMN reductase